MDSLSFVAYQQEGQNVGVKGNSEVKHWGQRSKQIRHSALIADMIDLNLTELRSDLLVCFGSVTADLDVVDRYNATPLDYARGRQLHYCQLILSSHVRQRAREGRMSESTINSFSRVRSHLPIKSNPRDTFSSPNTVHPLGYVPITQYSPNPGVRSHPPIQSNPRGTFSSPNTVQTPGYVLIPQYSPTTLVL